MGKKIKAIEKKLRQIDAIKEKKSSSAQPLDSAQLQKLSGEAQLRQQLKRLQQKQQQPTNQQDGHGKNEHEEDEEEEDA